MLSGFLEAEDEVCEDGDEEGSADEHGSPDEVWRELCLQPWGERELTKSIWVTGRDECQSFLEDGPSVQQYSSGATYQRCIQLTPQQLT